MCKCDECGNVKMLRQEKCGNVEMWKCENAATRKTWKCVESGKVANAVEIAGGTVCCLPQAPVRIRTPGCSVLTQKPGVAFCYKLKFSNLSTGTAVDFTRCSQY